jgi:6-phosphogluconolactonase
MHAPTVVYVSNANSKEIHVLHLNNLDGTVKVIQKTALPGAVMPLAISPTRRFLYASLRSEPFSVASLEINPATGEVSLRSTVPLPDNMCYLSVDKTGRFLFGASYQGSRFSINPIDEHGLVEAQPLQVTSTQPRAHSIVTDPSNRYLFVPSLGGDVIHQFKFDPQTGHATENTPPVVEASKGAGPRHLVFHPNHRFAYGTNELDASVNAYRFDRTSGTLTLVGTDSLLPPDFAGSAPFAAADVHITPDGRYLYASERASNTLSGFRVDAETGALTSIAKVPTENHPRGFNIDPRGRYLLAVGLMSHSMTTYAINQDTGTLSPLYRFPMGENPNWVEIIDLPQD